MKVFLDFEASSLAKNSYPIEVAWIFEDGRSESHLIRPAVGWDDWNTDAQALHGISRVMLADEGEPHEAVANRMLAVLSGHDLLASAPSWDGKWLSVLLRAAGLPRHSLRLRDSDEAHREVAETILRDIVPADQLTALVAGILSQTEAGEGTPVAHRALPDAEAERARWLAVRAAAAAFARKEAQEG